MGSKDRRAVSRMLYHYFRLGTAAAGDSVLDRLVLAEFLCATQSDLVEAENTMLAQHLTDSLEDKIALLEEKGLFQLTDLFSFMGSLSPQVDPVAFARQFLVQPDLFVRMRSGKEKDVMQILEKHQIAFEQQDTQTLVLANGTSLVQIKALNGLVEVQDLSSQQSLNMVAAQSGEHWWDACSGAGGKSLLLLDKFPGVNLLVSDTRNSVLKNLDARFDAAGIKEYRRKIIDLTKLEINQVLEKEQFDGIILDAPCSGSGTWARTPEMLTFFNAQSVTTFSELQKRIAAQVLPFLKPGKDLIYITCSAFEEENESVVDYLVSNHSVSLVSSNYIPGYTKRADTMFVAKLMKK